MKERNIQYPNTLREAEFERDSILLLEDKLRPASIEDYEQWLAGYLKRGERPAHSYDYPIPEHTVVYTPYGWVRRGAVPKTFYEVLMKKALSKLYEERKERKNFVVRSLSQLLGFWPEFEVLSEFAVASKDFETAPLYGSSTIHIIVPTGIRFLGGELGHINLYLMDGFRNIGMWVPVYSNLKTNRASQP